MIKSNEDLFKEFISTAKSWGMDTTLHPTLNKYFQNPATEDCWLMFTRAYWKGVMDSDSEHRSKGLYNYV